MFESFFNATLGRLLDLPEPYGLLALSFILTLVTTLAYKFFTDQNLMKKLKDDMKDMQTKIKEDGHSTEQKMSIQKDLLEKNMSYMKQSFKPMLITFLPIILVFGWLRNYYTALGNPKVFFGLTWIWAYIIFSIAMSIIMRKLLKLH